jgi:hypothetical protein
MKPSKLTKEQARAALNEILERYRSDGRRERLAPGNVISIDAAKQDVRDRDIVEALDMVRRAEQTVATKK